MFFTRAKNTLESAKATTFFAWYQLDIDQDGTVSYSDIKESIRKSYTFMVRLSWEDINTYKLALFKNAISYMKDELENDKKSKEIVMGKKLSV